MLWQRGRIRMNADRNALEAGHRDGMCWGLVYMIEVRGGREKLITATEV